MERAYADLRNADPKHVQIAEVAESWRFNEPSSFSRRFRQQFGRCPSEVLGSDVVHHEAAPPELIKGADIYAEYTRWFNNASNVGS